MILQKTRTKHFSEQFAMATDAFDLVFGVILSVIVCFGVCGNVLSFIIWTKGRRCKKSPGGIFMRALDLADTFVLLVCATDKAMALLGTYRLRQVNTFFCKLHKTGWHFGLLVSTWIVVCFTLERTIVLGQPKRAAKLTSRGKTIGIVVSIYVVSLLLNIPWAIGSDIMSYPNTIFVTFSDNSTNTTTGRLDYVIEKLIVEDDGKILANTSRGYYENKTVYDGVHVALLENGSFFKTVGYSGFIKEFSKKDQSIILTVVNITTHTNGDVSGKLLSNQTIRYISHLFVSRSRQEDQFYRTVRIRFSNPKNYCGWGSFSFISEHEEAYHFWFIDFFLIFSIPFTIILSCNMAILVMVVLRRKKLQTKTRKGSLVQSVTTRAVALSLVHCLSTAPFSVSILIPEFYNKAFISRTGPQYHIGVITVVCSYINNGVNFVLYSFFGTDFRRDCADLLRRKSRVVPAERSHETATRTNRRRSFLQLCRRCGEHHPEFNKPGVSTVSSRIHGPSTTYETGQTET